MLQFFRKFFATKFGAGIAIAILVLIAFAFTSGDVANTGGFGGVAGGDRVAMVGDDRIDNATLAQAATSAVERVREEDPTISMKTFLAEDGLEQVLDDLIDRMAIAVFGKDNGIVVGERLIDSEISQIPAFRGADGKFSEETLRLALSQRGLSEQMMRDDISQSLIARQVMLPASVGSVMPEEMARRYATLLRETRKGQIAVIPSIAFVEKKEPTDKELEAYYRKNRDNFIRPERRTIRYASFSDTILKDLPEPTESEIAFRYNANQEQYEAREKRRITQLIVPTQAAAQAVVDEVGQGKSLEDAAKAKGLAATALELFSRSELAGQFSDGVAQAVFAASSGKIAKPAKSALGWHVARVEEIDSRPARTLDQVRGELSQEIATEKRRIALAEALEGIEDRFDSGGNLQEVADAYGLKVQKTAPVTADGNVYMKPGQRAPAVLARVLETAFAMETEEPQLAEVERGTAFVVYDVTDIEESAPAPLKEIRQEVRSAFILDKAQDKAKKAAEKMRSEIGEGKSPRAALNAIGKRLPPVQSVSMSRPELSRMQQQQQQVPPPLALMFNMAEGTTKALPAPDNRGWFVVSLDDIIPGKIGKDDRIIEAARRELGTVLGSEYTDALGRAIRDSVGVERNPDGIRAVREQLGGG